MAPVLVVLVCAATDLPRLAVLDVKPLEQLDTGRAELLTNAVFGEVVKLQRFQPLGRQDLTVLLGLERQRQLTGCTEDSASCMAELAGALGADLVLTGSLGRLGGLYRFELKLLSASKAHALGVTSADVPVADETAFLAAAERLVRELVRALPAPPGWAEPPLHYGPGARLPLPALQTGAGAVALLGAGVVFGVIAQGSYQVERANALGGDHARYDAARAAVSWQAPTADVLYAAAGVAAVAAVLLFLFRGAEP